ncbi:ribbon-helix-helix domain-containing protein [Streptomyces sp. A3M-1-3]|uniref:ribbon-helix-helix domain-containing protein n=1 Tax=Streptomyces sp. A3M-1-3 TaxID=2962044 RepID=UPI0020B7BD46|nr:CopG family transcriptional regulator [Streptomyces sp. A3M-1-3]MCP3816608.1 ribbon-helix-helix domain-containing protein [Streptomyces sp. A3M-1-3]
MTLKRTTVYLEDEDLRELKETATRRGISEAELIREGVRLALVRNRTWDEPADLPVFDSGDPGFAESSDDILRDSGFGSWNEAS